MKNIKLIILLLIAVTFSLTCKKDKIVNPCDASVEANIPKIKTTSVVLENDKIIVKGSVTNVGGDENGAEYSICWKKNATPTATENDGCEKIIVKSSTDFTKEFPTSQFSNGEYQFGTFIKNCAGESTGGAVKKVEISFTSDLKLADTPISFVEDNKNNNNFPESGEKVFYKLYIVNSGNTDAKNVEVKLTHVSNPPKVTDISPASISFGTVPASGSEISAKSGDTPNGKAYSFAIDFADNLDVGTIVEFKAEIIIDGKSQGYESFTITIAGLDYQYSYEITSTSDGDKIPESGETIYVNSIVKNTGSIKGENIKITLHPDANSIKSVDPISYTISSLPSESDDTKSIKVILDDNLATGTVHKIEVKLDEKVIGTIKIKINAAELKLASETPTYIDDQNHNQQYNQGEWIEVQLDITNKGDAPASNINVTVNHNKITQKSHNTIANIEGKTTKSIKIKMELADDIPLGEISIPIKITTGDVSFDEQFKINILSAISPNIVYKSHSLKSAPGNNINAGEDIQLNVILKNTGTGDANNVSAIFEAANPDKITNLSANPIQYGAIQNGKDSNQKAISFSIPTSTESGQYKIYVTPTADGIKMNRSEFFIDVEGALLPELDACGLTIQTDDNNNNIINPGETVTADFCIINRGEKTAVGISGTFESVEGITFPNGNAISFASTTKDEKKKKSFTFKVKDNIAPNTIISLKLNIDCDDCTEKTIQYEIEIGKIIKPNFKVCNANLNIISTTNQDLIANPGENVTAKLCLKNDGGKKATQVKGTLKSVNGISFTNTNVSFNDININSQNDHDITFTLANTVSSGTKINLLLDVSCKECPNNTTLNYEFTVGDVLQPILAKCSTGTEIKHTDNNDKIINPGETVTYNVCVFNDGNQEANNVTGYVTSSTNGVNITQSNLDFGSLDKNGGMNTKAFSFSTNPGFSSGSVQFNAKIECDGCSTKNITITENVGDVLCPSLSASLGNNNELNFNSSASIELIISNASSAQAAGHHVKLTNIRSNSNKITGLPSSKNLGDIDINDSKTIYLDFNIGDFPRDEDITFSFDIESDYCDGISESVSATVLGRITEADGLQAYYTFDNQSVEDELGNYNGINSGVQFVNSTTIKGEGRSAWFDNESFFDIYNLDLGSSSSFNLWIRSFTGLNETIFQTGSTNTGSGGLAIYNGKIRFSNYEIGNSIIQDLLDGQWHMLTINRTSTGKTKMYIDGIFKGEKSHIPYFSSTYPLRFGSTHGSGISSYYFHGYLDNIRIYNSTLSETAIQNIYNNEGPSNKDDYTNITNISKGLVAYYDFDNQQIADNIGNYNNEFNSVSPFSTSFNSHNNGYSLHFNNTYFDIIPKFMNELAGVSINIWIKTNSSKNETIFQTGNTNTGSGGLAIYNGKIRFSNYEIGNSIIQSLTNGQWHMLSIVRTLDGKTKMYIDKVFLGEKSHIINFSSSYPLRFGSTHGSGISSYYFKGDMDNIRIYNRPLSSQDIQVIYNEEK